MKNKENIRPLCLSFWAPPVVRPQAILLGKMLPEWIAQGVTPVLVTYDVCIGWDIDIPMYYIPQQPPVPWWAKILGLSSRQQKRYFELIVDLIEPIVKKHNINLLYSFAKPHESNVIGAMLKERLGIPFVAHMSDPWYENFFASRFRSGKKQILEMETYVIEQCDRVNFIVREMKELVMKKYGKVLQAKARVMHHFFQPNDYPKKQVNGGRFMFSHIGILRRERNPEILYQAFSELLKRRPDLSEAIGITLVGSVNEYTAYTDKEVKKMIHVYGLEQYVTVVPTVRFEESLQYMMDASCLVVIDANIPKVSHILCKAIDYLGSGNSIVGIMPHDNPTAALLKEVGYESFDYTQASELSTYMEGLISGTIVPEKNQDIVDTYHVGSITADLLDQFEELISDNT
ncbi:MAG: hypothetical protein COU33_02340 [Candidatus Magasanikbacteria bacterium CG10_big_fil_rev_8_21_14_0_10_43_6]|uniref:Glycosyltransferase subfamily 4-like N-terminal domain-containing protein n=1 Tax=Candidatus Magasanikbacteria bacterium CG10_big_fil_rev_8_21_14_0_10_43_6 TaxID=1974650 RepID=A0A2M6W1J6_9BACT|nr:MAG: hypothetical protein COU33_02340 [Candidatus Magasanikbacteria bacterium CG10_big_fil_rev_8_21_14_0_10_43_6]